MHEDTKDTSNNPHIVCRTIRNMPDDCGRLHDWPHCPAAPTGLEHISSNPPKVPAGQNKSLLVCINRQLLPV